MMRVAVLDDSREDIERLTGYLRKFETDRYLSIQIDTYNSSFDFLEEFRSQYDVLFLDIEMPGSDGMEVAREVRSKDEAVGIIFVTNMAQYAVQGKTEGPSFFRMYFRLSCKSGTCNKSRKG